MKPDVKRILAKLSETKVELATEKVELAKKPDAIIKAVESLKDKAQQAEDKMEDMYKRYSSFNQDYREKLAKIDKIGLIIANNIKAELTKIRY